MRTYGSIHLGDVEGRRCWQVKGEPHILIRLRRIFGQAHLVGDGFTLSDTDENRRDLEWFLARYAMEISAADRAAISEGAGRHEDQILLLEKIIDPSYTPKSFELALPPRAYQAKATQIYLARKSLLVADQVGLGKTLVSIASFTDPRTLPALVVTKANLMPDQWASEVAKFAPALTTHILKKSEPYELPKKDGRGPDVVISTYHKLANGWAGALKKYVKSVVFDECQELRRRESLKYKSAKHLADEVDFRCGLSATPIFNYGGEIWNVMNVIAPDAMGTHGEFVREWCVSQGMKSELVTNPEALGAWMRENFLMLRRTRKDVGRELPPLIKIVQKVDSDPAALDRIKDSAAALARIILSEEKISPQDRFRASEELSWKLRQATGIAKAPYVADFIRLLVESGEQVVVYAWHREVYTILQAKLEDLNPLLFTGSETPKQKAESKRAFVAKETSVLLMSIRAAAGLDGLQHVSKTVVIAELDWSPGVAEQAIGRVHRDGQSESVTTFFLVSDSGSDPVVAEMCGLKQSQVDGLRDPERSGIEKLQTDAHRARRLAEFYVKKHGAKCQQTASVSAEGEEF